jgi:hypothetical protein
MTVHFPALHFSPVENLLVENIAKQVHGSASEDLQRN